MKKFLKVMLVIAAVFASIGLGLAVCGAVMGAGSGEESVVQEVEKYFRNTFDLFYSDDWGDNDTGEALGKMEEESRVYQFSEAERLEIELSYDELILDEHDGTGIIVEVKHDSKGNVNVKEAGNTLKITSTRKLEKRRQVKVSYPKDMKLQEADIEVAAGAVDIRRDVSADKMEIMLGAGEFVNSGTITVVKADFEVGAGELNVTGLNAREIDGQCGVGELRLEINGKEENYSYSLECGIGNIEIGEEDYSGFGKEKRIDNPGAAGEIALECGIGNISVEFTEKEK